MILVFFSNFFEVQANCMLTNQLQSGRVPQHFYTNLGIKIYLSFIWILFKLFKSKGYVIKNIGMDYACL